MCIRHLGLVLLISFPGVLHAQSATQTCSAPTLDGGIFLPKQQAYSHGTELTYACDDGRKPTVKGWWATSTCQNGKWSHEPQCIDEAACLPPEIPNAKYTQSSNGWYEEGRVIRTTCDTGYEHKNQDATAECNNGIWSSVPVCEKSINACGVPPKVPHAVIIHQGYQEVFAPDSEVQYQCEDGYTVKGAHNNKSIFCISGQWTEGPACRKGTRPGTGHGGSTVGGTGGGHTTSAGSGTQPGGGGSSATSGSNGGDSRPPITTIDFCGAQPLVPNGVAWSIGRMSLKYQCNSFYTLVGSETVVCYSDRSWSELPTCKEAFCVLRPGQYVWGHLRVSAPEYIKEGETKHVYCRDSYYYYHSVIQCTNGQLTKTNCCQQYDHDRGACPKNAL